MKKIACVLILALALAGTGSAYLINCDCPSQVTIGQVIEIRGTSNLPPGFSTDIVMYKETREIVRNLIVIQNDGTWFTMFSTSDLSPGQYKLEILEKSVRIDGEYLVYGFGTSSDTLMILNIVDRSDEIQISSPLIQGFTDMLEIEGTAEERLSNGVEMTVKGPTEIVFGPSYISTDERGKFSHQVNIFQTGAYDVTFSDEQGVITTITFYVKGATTPPTPASTVSSENPLLSATALVSRDNPAYFEVGTRTGILVLSTSTGIDWVIEYIDEDEQLIKVNSQGILNPEMAELTTRGGMVFVKAYPVKHSVEASVTLYAENAESITSSSSAASAFGDEPPATPAPESPLPISCAIGAIAVLFLIRMRH